MFQKSNVVNIGHCICQPENLHDCFKFKSHFTSSTVGINFSFGIFLAIKALYLPAILEVTDFIIRQLETFAFILIYLERQVYCTVFCFGVCCFPNLGYRATGEDIEFKTFLLNDRRL